MSKSGRKLSPRRVNHAGKKYNSWTAIKFAGIDKSGGAIWLCRCNCGTERYVAIKGIIKGTSKSCGCERGEYNGTISLGREVWRVNYSDGDIIFEYFLELSQQNCYYCGAKPNNKKSHKNPKYCDPFIYNGLDRVDNTKGHQKDNVVPCCWECNEWKANYTKDKFLEKATKIHIIAIERTKEELQKSNIDKITILAKEMTPNYFCPIWE